MKVVRISESELHDMIVESVKRSLYTEGAFGEFLKASGKGLANIGKYAKSRIWDGHGEHSIGDKDYDEKLDQAYSDGYGEGKNGSPHDTRKKFKDSKKTPSSESES